MGLISKILNIFKPNNLVQESQENSQPIIHRVQYSHTAEINIDGHYETQIYTYLGVIFKGIKKGEEFYVDVIPDDITIHSKSTGTSTSTDGFTTAVSYNGKPFGTLGYDLNFLKEVRKAGFAFRLKVKKTGMYSAGIPELKAETIFPRYLREWWDKQKYLQEDIPLPPNNLAEIDININDVDKNNYEINEEWSDISITTSLLPVPEKSKAKPHILIESNGIKLSEMSAHSTFYKTLINYIGIEPYKAMYRLYESNYETGKFWLKIKLIYDADKEKVNENE